ncbi:unnamed protein product [Clonostachys chloroleuca]|uniref:Domain of unknown function at the cortex 1 domain-containing protein n=1 Tax=Clonostachys chloroleuca TaxID=1926264 RepID=A0AA35MFH3_9HYPO|nr:unnamed protein product [Clonostachys chloroleuca]
MADRYILRITAGPDYDLASHVEIPVNTAEPVHINSDRADIQLNVRVNDYQGLPYGSPGTSPYFEAEPHKYNQDQYSICFRFTPKRPAAVAKADEKEGGVKAEAEDDAKKDVKDEAKKESKEDTDEEDEEDEDEDEEVLGISGLDLQFGNDFDRPIRDRLPPGFNTAMGIVRWWVDPGLDGDAYADRPYLYGPALSSFNALHVGEGEFDPARGGIWVEEGGDEEARAGAGAPADRKARMKWALSEAAKESWVWEYGRTYALDFFNPYLDFANLALRLPGFHLPIMKYWDGQGLRSTPKRSHTLRYVLRNRATGEVYMTVCFTLYLKEDVNEDGTLKEGVDGSETSVVAKAESSGDEEFDEEAALKEAAEKLRIKDEPTKTSSDDLD